MLSISPTESEMDVSSWDVWVVVGCSLLYEYTVSAIIKYRPLFSMRGKAVEGR